MSQASTAFNLVKDYMQIAQENDSAFFVRILPHYVKHCTLPNKPSTRFETAEDVYQGMTCTVDVGTKHLPGTDLEAIWKTYKASFEKTMRAFAKCQSKNDQK